MFENVFVCLLGFSGTGKLTVAKALAPKLQAKVVDNHWINNPIFKLLDTDGVTPLPDAIWPLTQKVREAVLETMASLSAPSANFIMTFAGHEGDVEDRNAFLGIQQTAERRGALFVPVRLVCAEEELVRRIVSPERRVNHKSVDPEFARRNSREAEILKPDLGQTLTLDVTDLSPDQSVARILEHIATCAES